MFAALAKSIFGTHNDRVLKGYIKIVDAVNAWEKDIQALSDTQLAAQTDKFKSLLAQGKTLDDILPEAFATVREASIRTLGLRPFDVQIMGAMALHEGMIPEMRTGEGKTLTATLSVYLNALSGKGVHVVTVNDYLAMRDANWMKPIFEFLGLSVGYIIGNLPDEMRKAAYDADITYGTNNEFGFDYLRDNMKFRLEDMVQRAFHYAIVDEVDSILIDEARTPLIISGAVEDSAEQYNIMNQVIPRLVAEDYEVDEKQKSIALTDKGNEHAEEIMRKLGILTAGGLYDMENMTLVHHLNQALRAHKLFRRDVDYIVKDNAVVIIDEFTGRMMDGRRFAEGLHQALEAKEGVKVQNENQTLASITFQNYFRLYPKLAGMTGTAMTEKEEFEAIYNLSVVEIPTNVPAIRKDENDEIYRTAEEKYEALVGQIADCHRRSQPVLVGTVSIEKSEHIASLLKDRKFIRQAGGALRADAKALMQQAEEFKRAGKTKMEGEARERAERLELTGVYMEDISTQNVPLPHSVLNARYHEQEAAIIALAGKPGAITIATNMAGRGTDIKLGGNVDIRIEQEIPADADDDTRKEMAEAIRKEVASAYTLVKAAGGLYVIGSERHESRRIDNQLRGRSGRQGDPGASKFYISLEDDLMRIFGSEKMDAFLQRMGLQRGQSIIHPMLNSAIERAQKRVEAQHFEARKFILRFDNVMNDQRKVIYEQRREIMDTNDVSDIITDMRAETIGSIVENAIPEDSYVEQWDMHSLRTEAHRLLNVHLPTDDWAKEDGLDARIIETRIQEAVDTMMAEKYADLPEEVVRQIEKSILLQLVDEVWKEHLLNLDHLKQGIGLRGYAQKDPLNEYKAEAFSLFQEMMAGLRQKVTERLCRIGIHAGAAPAMPKMRTPQKTVLSRGTLPPEGPTSATPKHLGPVGTVDPQDPATWASTPRNGACPCGSGKKYKYCHGKLA